MTQTLNIDLTYGKSYSPISIPYIPNVPMTLTCYLKKEDGTKQNINPRTAYIYYGNEVVSTGTVQRSPGNMAVFELNLGAGFFQELSKPITILLGDETFTGVSLYKMTLPNNLQNETVLKPTSVMPVEYGGYQGAFTSDNLKVKSKITINATDLTEAQLQSLKNSQFGTTIKVGNTALTEEQLQSLLGLLTPESTSES